MEQRTTILMRAHCEERFAPILAAIQARENEPFKSPSPDHGIDVNKIRQTCLAARKRSIIRDAILAALYLYALTLALPFISEEAATEEADIFIPAPELPIGMLLVVYAVMAAVYMLGSLVSRHRARQVLQQMPSIEADMPDPQPLAQSAVIVSGGFVPFVGAGHEVLSWSFTVDLTEPSDASKPVRTFSINTLLAALETRFTLTLQQPCPIADVLFVDGRDVQTVGPLMPGGPYSRPVSSVPSENVAAIVAGHERVVRTYKCLKNILWGGQLPVNTFYRFTRSGDLLFCETRMFVMPPLRDEFRAVEQLPTRMTVPEGIRMLSTALIAPLWQWLVIAKAVAAWLAGGFLETLGGQRWHLRRNRKQIRMNRRYNYGWSQSLRELWSIGSTYERYFQMIDQDFQVKVIKETMMSTLLSHLEHCNIRTDDFKGTSSRIVNEGIIISGGTVQAESLTAGRQARSFVNRMIKRPPAAKAA